MQYITSADMATFFLNYYSKIQAHTETTRNHMIFFFSYVTAIIYVHKHFNCTTQCIDYNNRIELYIKIRSQTNCISHHMVSFFVFIYVPIFKIMYRQNIVNEKVTATMSLNSYRLYICMNILTFTVVFWQKKRFFGLSY